MGEMKFYLFLGINKMKKPLLILFFLTMIFSCKENTEGISTNIQEKEDLDITNTFKGNESISIVIMISECSIKSEAMENFEFFDRGNIENVKYSLKSYSLVEKTVKSLSLDTSKIIFDELINKYINSLEFKHHSDSSFLEISVRDNTKQTANFLNTLVKNYQEHNIESKQRFLEYLINFLDEEIAITADTLTKLERQLQDYRNSNQVIDLEIDSENKEIIEITKILTYYEKLYNSLLSKRVERDIEFYSITSDIIIYEPAIFFEKK